MLCSITLIDLCTNPSQVDLEQLKENRGGKEEKKQALKKIMMSAEGCILTNPTSGMLLGMFSLLQKEWKDCHNFKEHEGPTRREVHNTDWDHDLREKRAKQKRRMDDERQVNTNVNDSHVPDPENMSPTEL